MPINDRALALYMRAHAIAATLAARARAPRGQGLVEYALIVAFVAIACIAAAVFLGHSVSHNMTTIGGTLNQGSITPTPCPAGATATC